MLCLINGDNSSPLYLPSLLPLSAFALYLRSLPSLSAFALYLPSLPSLSTFPLCLPSLPFFRSTFRPSVSAMFALNAALSDPGRARAVIVGYLLLLPYIP